MATNALATAALQAWLGPQRTAAQAEAIGEQGREAVVFSRF
jgi:hypothetical protein